MPRSIIVEGKTTSEAIEKGLKELNVTKNMVEIKQIEEKEKRSFYSILAPRVVKIEMTVKENEQEANQEKKERRLSQSQEDLEESAKKADAFLNSFLSNFSNIGYEVKIEDSCVNVNISGDEINYLIGYRGETLNALQNIMSVIINKGKNEKTRIIVDIGGYKDRRKKTLEELAEKVAKTVIRTKKTVTLDPMTAYERKIIHTALQSNDKIETYSKGMEPNRRVVITLK